MIKVKAGKEAIEGYRQLLSHEWTKELPEQVLSLLNQSVIQEANRSAVVMTLRELSSGGQSSEFFQQMIDRLEAASHFDTHRGLPAFPKRYHLAKSPPREVVTALMLAIYLTLPAHNELEGEIHFFADLQSLAYLACIHELLSALRKKHPAEHAILLRAMALMLIDLEHDLAHYFYLLSLLYEYLGNTEKRLESLLGSFRLTSPDDHSYLTKAQEYWSSLLDEHQDAKARDFLLQLHWKSLPEQQVEIGEMLVDALEVNQAKRRKRVKV